jgi:AbrB family looped-hinge helix DNA binding protein
MNIKISGHPDHKFYGATTIGERGQVVIPAEARRDLGLEPSDKLLVFGVKNNGGLMLARAETFTEMLSKAAEMLNRYEQILKATEEPAQKAAEKQEKGD